MTDSNERRTNAALGYPDDARLLIVNADDFGMCQASNEATLRAWQDGIVTSTTVMTPCPWAPHALRILREHPEFPFGVHLTLVCEWSDYGWGPISSKGDVPTLVDERGFFHHLDRIPEMLARAEIGEVEREFRAQIAAAQTAGRPPTHLDWHCLADGGRPDIFDLTLELAVEHRLTLRVHQRSSADAAWRAGLPSVDHDMLDSYRYDPDDKAARFIELLRALPAGLSEWAVHPSMGSIESQTIEPTSWRIRRTDYDFLISPEARATIDAEGIVLLDYGALQKAWHA